MVMYIDRKQEENENHRTRQDKSKGAQMDLSPVDGCQTINQSKIH